MALRKSAGVGKAWPVASAVAPPTTPTPSPTYMMDFRVPANARYTGAML